MNPAIEHLNHWGAPFVSLAGALLWQSTLLGLVLLLLDFALRRRVRAAVRYALWLVLLAKLVLPPSLALPTSPTWWWSSARAQTPAPAPQFQNVTTTQDDLPLRDFLPASVPVAPPPTLPALTPAAWSLLTACGVSLLLLGWLALRWRQVTRTTRMAEDDPATALLLAEACRLAKIHWRVRVKITRATISPAVCGLWRPVILLPRSLTDTLSSEQLRAVLVHELMHLRRGDVWVNFAQALLQIGYWWHPLVWLANARLRHLREEAVDDAVVAALNDEAEIYAPTLLAVARFALQRPLASLGLVGILESRSALRQRIERLVNFPAPRKAGLGLASAFGLLIFSAVALPMGDAPAPAPASHPANLDSPTNAPVTPASSAYVPPVTNPYLRSDLVYTGSGRHDLVSKLNHIRLASVSYDGRPLSEVLSNLSEQVRLLSPDKTGINFVINPNPNLSDRPGAAAAGEVPPPAEAGLEAGSVLIHLHLSNVWLSDVLNAMVMVADHPIQYSIQDFGVVFSAKAPGAEALATRSFKVDADTSLQGLESVGSASFGATSAGRSSGGGANTGNGGGAVVPVVNVTPGAAQARPTQGGAAANNTPAAQYDSSPGRQTILRKLNKIRYASVSYDNLPLSSVLRDLWQQSKSADPEKTGVKLLVNPKAGHPTAPAAGTSDETVAVGDIPIKMRLTDVRLSDVLDAIVLVAGKPIKYSIQDFAVVFSAKSPEATNLFSRSFKVDPNTFIQAVESVTSFGLSTGGGISSADHKHTPDDINILLPNFCKLLGLNFTVPGKAVFFNDRIGWLFVRGTKEDLDTIERAIETLNSSPSAAGASKGDLNEAGRLVQEGKLLYGMGDWDGSEAKLNQAVALDPQNVTAHYYLNLIDQARKKYGRETTAPVKWPVLKSATASGLPADTNINLYQRTFRINADAFEKAMQKANSTTFSGDQIGGMGGLEVGSRQNPAQGTGAWVRDPSTVLGVDLHTNGKFILFAKKPFGLLFVGGTRDDLDNVERALESQKLKPIPQQLHIKARFLEITGEIGDIPTLYNHLEGQTRVGIMAAEPARKFLHQLQTRPGTEALAEPEVTTLEGRHTQMRATETRTILTGVNPKALTPPGISKFEATNGADISHGTSLMCGQDCEFGSIMDVEPEVLSDGYTVNLTTIASDSEFVRYDGPTHSVTAYVEGKPETVPVPCPQFKMREFTTSLDLYDGQTLLLSQPVDPRTGQLVEQSGRKAKHLLVLVSVLFVDAAGNRLHTDAQMPFARDRVPPQDDSTPFLPSSTSGPRLDDRPFDQEGF